MLSQEEQTAKDLKVIVFHLLNEQFGVDVNQVKSIERLDHITKVPRTPSFVEGVIHLRGAVIPIVDLKDRLEMGQGTPTNQSRVIISSVGGCDIGFIVDSANDVIDLPVSSVEPPPRILKGLNTHYLRGIAKYKEQLLILLNLDRLLDTEEIEQILQGEGLT